MANKYQEALRRLKTDIERSNCEYNVDDYIATLQELVDKETPMKVDKKHYELVDSDAGEYFIVSDYYYKCPNSKCKLHKKYEIYFEEKRCPECNQLLDWR